MNKRASELPKLRDGSEWDDSGDILFGEASVVGICNQDTNKGAIMYIVKDTDDLDEYDTDAYASDVLALLDANGLNTTADALRETRQRKAMSIKKTLETLLELRDIVDANTFSGILEYMDENGADNIRIERDTSSSERELREHDEQIGTIESVWSWVCDHGEDHVGGEIFIPLPDGRFIAFGFYS